MIALNVWRIIQTTKENVVLKINTIIKNSIYVLIVMHIKIVKNAINISACNVEI